MNKQGHAGFSKHVAERKIARFEDFMIVPSNEGKAYFKVGSEDLSARTIIKRRLFSSVGAIDFVVSGVRKFTGVCDNSYLFTNLFF